jgi:hypothetical protein
MVFISNGKHAYTVVSMGCDPFHSEVVWAVKEQQLGWTQPDQYYNFGDYSIEFDRVHSTLALMRQPGEQPE